MGDEPLRAVAMGIQLLDLAAARSRSRKRFLLRCTVFDLEGIFTDLSDGEGYDLGFQRIKAVQLKCAPRLKVGDVELLQQPQFQLKDLDFKPIKLSMSISADEQRLEEIP